MSRKVLLIKLILFKRKIYAMLKILRMFAMWKRKWKTKRERGVGIRARRELRKIEGRKGMIAKRKIIRIVVMVREIGLVGSIIKETMISIRGRRKEKKEKGQIVLLKC